MDDHLGIVGIVSHLKLKYQAKQSLLDNNWTC